VHALIFPLRYLRLKTEKGWRLWMSDIPAAVAVGLLLSCPYMLIDQSNFFHKDGFLDKIGTFSSVLTGFYVAGLVAVATFPRNEAGLDKTIEVGKIKVSVEEGEEDEYLTRREYVCSMFGYLAFSSLLITAFSIVAVTTSDGLSVVGDYQWNYERLTIFISKSWLRGLAIGSCSVALGHVFATTVRGLYYLIDRIYAFAPTPLPRKDDTV
jgi:hypothetical protein